MIQSKNGQDIEQSHFNSNRNCYFDITKNEIDSIFNAYNEKKFKEDLEIIESLGGGKMISLKLKSDLNKGIPGEDYDKLEREKHFSSNKKVEEKMQNFFYFLWESSKDLMLRILFICAIIQIGLGASSLTLNPKTDWIEGVSILIGISIEVLVTSSTNFSKEKQFKKLNDFSKNMIKFTVIRAGKEIELLPSDLLVGDIVEIKPGEVLPADGILISESELKVDESALTGEGNLIEKESLENCIKKCKRILKSEKHSQRKFYIPSPILMSGTQVEEGYGRYLVLQVGVNSAKGQIDENIKHSLLGNSHTPLEIKLDKLATNASYIGFTIAILLFLTLIIRFGVIFSERKNAYQQYISSHPENETNSDSNESKEIQPVVNPNETVAHSIIEIIMVTIAIMVVSLPEALPLGVTLSLAFSIKKMMSENNLVKRMHACETMGSANYILTDKTGTLTTNHMIVESFFDGVSILKIEENQNSSQLFSHFHPIYLHTLKNAISLNLTLEIDENENFKIKSSAKTEQALCDFVHLLGVKIYPTIQDFYAQQDEPSSSSNSEPRNKPKLKRLLFNSKRKRMSTVVRHENLPTGFRIYTKGAAEIISKSLSHYLDPETGELIEIDDFQKFKIKNVIKTLANKALRLIAIAFKDLTEEEFKNYNKKVVEANELDVYSLEQSDFILLGIAGFEDQVKDNIPLSVSICHRAGLRVIMVTGDNQSTALAIARKCNILPNRNNLTLQNKSKLSLQNNLDKNNLTISQIFENVTMTGIEFYNLIEGIYCETCDNEIKNCPCPKNIPQAKIKNLPSNKIRKEKIRNMQNFTKIVQNLRVLARSRPMDKYALVLGLKELGNIVAVTGDGTNDAPALSKSDVGFAMFRQGTDIAKSAADILLLDDNFSSIITAILWGRNVLENIRKFIQFQIATNFSASILVLITACVGGETPLNPIQLLWINLIMNSLGSLALACEPPDDSLLQRKPYSRDEYIINSIMWKHIIVQTLILIGICLFLYLYGYEFIIENEPYRIEETKLIQMCYGVIPGRPPDKDGNYFILNGSNNAWPVNVYLIKELRHWCGKYSEAFNLSIAKRVYDDHYGSTSHMSIIFNTLVFYILFNQLTSRIVDDKINIFRSIKKNYILIIIFLVEVALQTILIEFSSVTFHIAWKGLTGLQWGISLGFACSTFFVNFILKFIPFEKICQKIFKAAKIKKSSRKQFPGPFKETHDISQREDKIPQKELKEINSKPPSGEHKHHLQEILRKESMRMILQKPSFMLKLREAKDKIEN